jgi:hypothetical protein
VNDSGYPAGGHPQTARAAMGFPMDWHDYIDLALPQAALVFAVEAMGEAHCIDTRKTSRA